MRVHFSSDMLFGRTKAAEDRKFESTDEMELELIKRWNARVKPEDLVYHLGNFAWDPISAETAMSSLNGTIVFGISKYDKFLPTNSLIQGKKHMILKSPISIIQGLQDIKKRIILSYWPLLDWPDKSKGVIHVHGAETKTDTNELRFNVSSDKWDLAPVEFDLIIDILEAEKKLKK